MESTGVNWQTIIFIGGMMVMVEGLDKVLSGFLAMFLDSITVLFREMRDKNYHLCVVIDEFGGTAGVVTINQLIEEIVGLVRDELLPQLNDFEIIDAHTYEADGNMRIEDANAEMELNLPEGDYETVAGFIWPDDNTRAQRLQDCRIMIK